MPGSRKSFRDGHDKFPVPTIPTLKARVQTGADSGNTGVGIEPTKLPSLVENQAASGDE